MMWFINDHLFRLTPSCANRLRLIHPVDATTVRLISDRKKWYLPVLFLFHQRPPTRLQRSLKPREKSVTPGLTLPVMIPTTKVSFRMSASSLQGLVGTVPRVSECPVGQKKLPTLPFYANILRVPIGVQGDEYPIHR